MPEHVQPESDIGEPAFTRSVVADPRRPRKAWYSVAVVLPALAVVLAMVYWMSSLQMFEDTVDGFSRFTPPGELVQTFDQGYVHVYAESAKVEFNAETDPPSPPQVEVFSPDGSPSELVPYLRLPGTNDAWTYEVAGHRGVGITSFFVDQPGEYTVIATGGDEIVLAVGEGIGQEREKFTFNAIGYAFLGFLAGGTVAGVIARMRRRSFVRPIRALG